MQADRPVTPPAGVHWMVIVFVAENVVDVDVVVVVSQYNKNLHTQYMIQSYLCDFASGSLILGSSLEAVMIFSSSSKAPSAITLLLLLLPPHAVRVPDVK